jgi:hypothetical protein
VDRSGDTPITGFRRPGRVRGTSRRLCLILVLCWAVPGAVVWSGEAFVPQSPDGWAGRWIYSVPSFVSLVVELTAGLLLLLWVVLPVLLLPVGFDYVRSVESPRWRWRGAWMGAAGAGIVLDVLMVPLVYPFMTATPDWGAFAGSLGFVAIGTVMIFVLFVAERSKAADRPQPGNLPGSAVA